MKKVTAFLNDRWMALSDSTRDHILSGVRVFGSVFVSVLIVALEGGIQWSWAFWTSLFAVAFSAGFKAAIQTWAPPALGGKK